MLEQSIIPTHIDSDTADTELSLGAVRYMLHCQVGSPQQSGTGIVSNKPGNVLISFSMPPGFNISLGSYEDAASKSVFYFVFNDLGNHQILRYFYEEGGNGHIEKIFQDNNPNPILNFQANNVASKNSKDSLITGVAFIDDKLYWTDNFNGQRKINVKKANNTGKKIIANIYFGSQNDGTFLTSNTYTFTTVLNGVTTTYTNTIGVQASLTALCAAYVTAFNLSAGTLFTFVSEGNWVQVTALTTDLWQLSATSNNGFCQLIYQNIYPQPYLIDFIDLGKYPPNFPPTATYSSDTTTKQNQVQQFVGQFRFRYIYDDYEPSVWSPYSKLIWTPDELDQSLNVIDVNFGNSRLSSTVSAIILRVEIAFRFQNNPTDEFIVALSQYEYITGRFKFYNDNQEGGIAQAESLKPYDAIPIKSAALEEIKDLLFLGGNLEGYDRVNVDASVKLGFNPSVTVKTWTIKGKIKITNNTLFKYPSANMVIYGPKGSFSNQPIHDYGQGPVFGGLGGYFALVPPVNPADEWVSHLHDTYDQRIPEGGFPVYLAGTPYWAVSKQVDNSAWTAPGGGLCGNSSTQHAPLKSSNPVVYDSSQYGGSPLNIPEGYCFKRESYRTAMREIMNNNNFYSTFEIKDVPPGTYYLRVASHWCSHGDKLGKGAIYNLDDPNLGWQKTSTNTYQVGGTAFTELKIILGDSGGILDLTQSPYGTTLIDDLSYPIQGGVDTVNMAAVGYQYDAGGSTDATLMSEGVAMEQQSMSALSGSTHFFATTDHNGYFFMSLYIGIFAPFFTTILTEFDSIKPTGFAANLVSIATSDNIFRGGLNDLLTKNLSGSNYKQGFDYAPKLQEYIAINLNSDITNYASTYIEGVIKDIDNKLLKDVSVIVAGCGRIALTGSDGAFKILVYGQYVAGNGYLSTQMQFFFPYFKGVYISGLTNYAIFISYSKSGDYNLTHPYIQSTSPITVELTSGVSFLKRGGLYQYGILHFDNLLRCPTVSIEDSLRLRIPFYTEDLHNYDPVTYPNPGTFNYTTPHISWQINSLPPSWAVAAAWVRTKILNYNSGYFEWVANSIQYISGFDASGTPIDTTYEAGNATLIMLDISNLTLFNQNQLNILVENSISGYPIGYSFQLGDRIRLMQDNNQNWYTTYFDAPIKQMEGLNVVIEALSEYPKIHAGTRFEIYNPISGEVSLFYYEIGNFIPIVNGAYAQTSGNFDSGDTYIVKRQIPVSATADSGAGSYQVSVESESISDLYLSKASDIGRAWIENKDLRQTLYGSGFRWSNEYISQTFTNGLSSFDGANEDLLPTEYGLLGRMVKSLIGTSSVLFCVQQTNCMSLYIKEAQIKDIAASRLIAISDGVVGGKALMDKGFGSSYPESIIEFEGRIYGYSDNRATVFRYSRDGMTDLGKEGKRINDLKLLSLGLSQQSSPTYVLGAYDPYNDEYLLTPSYTVSPQGFEQPYRRNQDTLTWNEKENQWTSNFKFNAEFYGKVSGTSFLSFYLGQLWLHNINPVYNNFYGVQYNSQIQAVFNIAPKTIKNWVMAGMKATDAWSWDNIETVANEYSPTGQQTSLLIADFSNFEGVFEGEILKDINTPYLTFPDSLINGDDIRGEVLHVTINLNGVTGRSVLWHIFTRMLESLPTQSGK